MCSENEIVKDVNVDCHSYLYRLPILVRVSKTSLDLIELFDREENVIVTRDIRNILAERDDILQHSRIKDDDYHGIIQVKDILK